MPYIKHERREAMGYGERPETPGELNYVISCILHEYLEVEGLSYTNINVAIGVLECAKLELYRQVATKYEDVKKKENGPVSNLDKE